MPEKPTISLVASSYELTCSCGYEEQNIQLSNFDRPIAGEEFGAWAWNCPDCKHRHIFDGNEVEHAY